MLWKCAAIAKQIILHRKTRAIVAKQKITIDIARGNGEMRKTYNK